MFSPHALYISALTSRLWVAPTPLVSSVSACLIQILCLIISGFSLSMPLDLIDPSTHPLVHHLCSSSYPIFCLSILLSAYKLICTSSQPRHIHSDPLLIHPSGLPSILFMPFPHPHISHLPFRADVPVNHICQSIVMSSRPRLCLSSHLISCSSILWSTHLLCCSTSTHPFWSFAHRPISSPTHLLMPFPHPHTLSSNRLTSTTICLICAWKLKYKWLLLFSYSSLGMI